MFDRDDETKLICVCVCMLLLTMSIIIEMSRLLAV